MGSNEGPLRAEDVFRRLFEARFRPLATRNPSEGEEDGLEEDDDDGDAEEWDGFSDDEEREEEDSVEVVESCESFVGAVDRVSRREVKDFMVRILSFFGRDRDDADSC